MASLPPDLKFGAAIVLLGVVMLTVSPPAAFWVGALLVLAALTFAEKDAKASGHSFIGDLRSLMGLNEVKP
jgi:hypothetical protein